MSNIHGIFVQKLVEGFAETEKGMLIMKIGTLILSKRNSSKRNTRIIKGTLILLNRNSYYQKGTPPKGTLPPARFELIWSRDPSLAGSCHLQGKFLWSLDRSRHLQEKFLCSLDRSRVKDMMSRRPTPYGYQ